MARQQGQLEGEQREAFRFLNRLLNRRFGEIDVGTAPIAIAMLLKRNFFAAKTEFFACGIMNLSFALKYNDC